MVRPIRLLLRDPQREGRVRAALAEFSVEPSNQETQDTRLVITDHARRDELVEQHGGVGVIAVAGGEGDVALDDDFTPRELRLVCELLDEIVDLRQANFATSRRQRHWQELALTDPLTGLANRRGWEAELQRRMHDAAANAFCLVILDLDHFKQINDKYGHAAGDAVLRSTADALQRSARGVDYLARLGGDEFGMILDGLSPDDAAAVCERIRTGVCRQLAAAAPRAVTASIGFAVDARSAGQAAESLYSAASGALRRAKQAGRDRTVAADD